MTQTERPRRGRPPHADRRPQIIQAAVQVLAERGYAHTSMKQIAESAGIAPGLLTYYFPTKQELLMAVVGALEKQFIGTWRDALRTNDEPMQRISAAFDRSIEIWSAHPETFRIFYDLSTLALVDDAVQLRLQEMLRRIRAAASEELARIGAALPTPIPADMDMAAAVTAGFHGALYEALSLGEDPRPALNALRFMVLSAAAMSYVAAGKMPPIDPDTLTVTPR